MNDEQVPSGSGKIEERQDQGKKDRQPEEAMEQDPDQAGWDDETASVGGASSLEINFWDDTKLELKRWQGRLNQRKMKFPRWNLPQPL